MSQPELVLASTSPFRRELLERLAIDFQCDSPDCDETPVPGESPQAMVQRLAEAKARSVADRYPAALVIGSDQCAELDGKILGKPGGFDTAFEQLKNASGRTVRFHTGLCLINSENRDLQVEDVLFDVEFRNLGDGEITRYLEKEQPYNCAGSFKSEGLGITLFERLRGDDPTALIGLPLIALCRMLRNQGVELP